MAQLSRIPVEWSGTAATGGGLSVFYSTASTPTTYLTALRGFFFSIAGLFPTDLTLTFPGGGDVFEATTGELVGDWTSTAPAVVTGTQAGAYAKGVGCRLVWRTAGITRGRRVRGSTFMVPIAANQYDTNGTLQGSVVSSLEGAGATLIAADSASMRIWTRPSASGASDGADHEITSAVSPDSVSWLRSRRT